MKRKKYIKAKDAVIHFLPSSKSNKKGIVLVSNKKDNFRFENDLTTGAVYTWWSEACKPKNVKETLLNEAWRLSINYKIDPWVVHKAMEDIEEYDNTFGGVVTYQS